MANQIIPIVISFILGILATVFTQFLIRSFSIDDRKRKLILGKINIIREVLVDYENLFKCEYPSLIDFIHAHDKLNPRAPYYDSNSPLKVYNALKQYYACRIILDSKKNLLDETLHYLVKYKIMKFRNKRRNISVNTMTIYYPDSKDNSIPSKLSKIKHLDNKLFNEFPKKVASYIEFEKLESIEPQNVREIISTKLRTKYDRDGKLIDIDNSEWEREFDLRDMADYFWQDRQEVSNLIQDIRVELNDLETKWAAAP